MLTLLGEWSKMNLQHQTHHSMLTTTLTPQSSIDSLPATVYLSSPDALSSKRVSFFTFTAQLGGVKREFNLMVRYGCASRVTMQGIVRELRNGEEWTIISDLKLEDSGFWVC